MQTLPQQELVSAMNQLYKKQNELYHQCAVRSGLSDTAFWVLYALCESAQTYTQNQLCEAWYLPKQTVNSAITVLVRDGLLALRPLEGQRRAKAVCLTAGGQAFCARHILPVLAAEQRSLAHMTAAEQQQFFALQEKQLALLQQGLADFFAQPRQP